MHKIRLKGMKIINQDILCIGRDMNDRKARKYDWNEADYYCTLYNSNGFSIIEISFKLILVAASAAHEIEFIISVWVPVICKFCSIISFFTHTMNE